ncbi:MAG: hypothetical protein PF693_14425 [Spirochaetia bacterium]|jgi:predicted restriction endonuclease|nr:hypothetical protein [Spirochaetia bacterium]
MTDKEMQKLEEMYQYYNYRCFVCRGIATNRAHILGQGRAKRHIYGNEVIDNILNWLPACDRHNDLIDMSNNQIGAIEVKAIIKSDISAEEKRAIIEEIVRENIKRKEQKIERRSNL